MVIKDDSKDDRDITSDRSHKCRALRSHSNDKPIVSPLEKAFRGGIKVIGSGKIPLRQVSSVICFLLCGMFFRLVVTLPLYMQHTPTSHALGDKF